MRTVEEHQAVVAALLPRAAGGVGAAGGRARPRAAARRDGGRRAAELRQLRDGRLRRPLDRGRRGAAATPVRLPVADDIPAGRTDVVPLAPGTVHRIMTGAPLPAGADVVDPGRAHRRRHRHGGDPRRAPPPAGTCVRPARTSPQGAVALAAGGPLGAAQLGAGRRRRARAAARCAGRPRVLVLSTGSELVAPGPAAAARADLRVELGAAGRGRGGGRRRGAAAALRARRRRPVPRHRARGARAAPTC